MTLWPRCKAESRTRRPVRPVAPMRRMSGKLELVDMMENRFCVYRPEIKCLAIDCFESIVCGISEACLIIIG